MFSFCREDLKEVNIQLEAQQKMEDSLRIQYNEVLGKGSCFLNLRCWSNNAHETDSV